MHPCTRSFFLVLFAAWGLLAACDDSKGNDVPGVASEAGAASSAPAGPQSPSAAGASLAHNDPPAASAAQGGMQGQAGRPAATTPAQGGQGGRAVAAGASGQSQPSLAGAGGPGQAGSSAGRSGSPASGAADGGAGGRVSGAAGQDGTGTSTPTVPNDVEAVMVETIYTADAAGDPTTNVRPVILFRDGAACRDINYFAAGLSADAHRTKYPNRWTEWKLINDKVALRSGQDKWTTLNFQRRYAPLARGTKLNGVWKHFEAASAGFYDAVIAAQLAFRFTSGGRFAQSPTLNGLSDTAAAGSAPADQSGTYEFEGYKATFRYDSGKQVVSTIVYSAEDAPLVFLGGRDYNNPNG